MDENLAEALFNILIMVLLVGLAIFMGFFPIYTHSRDSIPNADGSCKRCGHKDIHTPDYCMGCYKEGTFCTLC